MRLNKNNEELNKKCELLMSLGFEIQHRDCDVSFETLNVDFVGFDFSATAPDVQSIIYTALNHVYNLGLQQGKSIVQQDIKVVLGIGE
jgi:hypothetical protein